MDCPNKEKGKCKVVSALAREDYFPPAEACKHCQSSDPPQGFNKVTAGICRTILQRKGEKVPSQVTKAMGLPPETGPGTELKNILSWFGVKEVKGCKCKEHAAQMNKWGPDKCEQKLEQIVSWLSEELQRRSLPNGPIVRSALRVAVKAAIKRSKGAEEHIDQDAAMVLKEIENSIEELPEKDHREDQERNDRLVKEWTFVWTYWAGGASGDELRYSIRSVLDHHPNAKVVVVGDRPDWYAGEMLEKPRIEKTSHHAFKDCYSKILHAAERIEKFVWMMDDVYWINPFHMDQAIEPKYVRHVWPERYKGWEPRNKWANTRAAAYKWLFENNRPTYDYASHLPQPIVADSLLEMESSLRLMDQYMNWECLYFNTYHSANGVDWGQKTCRIAANSREVIDISKPILNHVAYRYEGFVEEFLKKRFPDQSEVEE